MLLFMFYCLTCEVVTSSARLSSVPFTSILVCVDSGVGSSSELFLRCGSFGVWLELLSFCIFNNGDGPSKSGFVVPERSMFKLLLRLLNVILMMILIVLWFQQDGLLSFLLVFDIVSASCWLLMLSLDLGLRPAAGKSWSLFNFME